ncbi:hypothetical protein R1flu_005575 [Riccia fluitans]|uniref:Uncharacterized protein n=1 Tax=Riccia fluitans TaxID=41844 RepID=A0ABD1YTJ7_9MARC
MKTSTGMQLTLLSCPRPAPRVCSSKPTWRICSVLLGSGLYQQLLTKSQKKNARLFTLLQRKSGELRFTPSCTFLYTQRSFHDVQRIPHNRPPQYTLKDHQQVTQGRCSWGHSVKFLAQVKTVYRARSLSSTTYSPTSLSAELKDNARSTRFCFLDDV